MTAPVRLKGKVAQAEPGQGFDHKWFFTLFMFTLDNQQIGSPCGPFGPYETEALALEEMKGALKVCCEEIELKLTGQVSGHYIDMQNGGVVRPWIEH